MVCRHCMAKIPDHATICEYCHHAPNSAPAPHHLSAGTVLDGHYLIGEAIGEGGFGITYIGRDLNLDMRVAVKEFYPCGYANRSNTVSNEIKLNQTQEKDDFNNAKEQFLREARNLAKFSKEPTVVDVRDYFAENNTAYIVMEYIEGVTLAQYLKTHGVFRAEDIVTRILPLTEALSKMHRQAIIHRDISPENIMMTDSGTLKLMDFGAARYYAGDDMHTLSVILKPGYAPFEQYSTKGKQGPWTDVYALCATIYKCVTCTAPSDALTRSQQDDLLPPSAFGIGISPQLEAVLLKGLAIDPADRIQNMDALSQALKSALRSDETWLLAEDPVQAPVIPSNNLTYGDGAYYDHQPLTRAQASKKNIKPALIIVIITAILLVIGGVIAIVLLSRSESKEKKPSEPAVSAVSSAASSAADATTAKATDAPANEGVVVPDVTGKKLSNAKEQLEQLGLQVETEEEASDTVAQGYVIRQSIAADREINRDDSIMLTISSGKPPTDAPAPVVVTEQPSQRIVTRETPYLIKMYPTISVFETHDLSAAVVMTLDEENVYTIVEEYYDGTYVWGRLKSGVGWVVIDVIFSKGGYLLD